MTFDRNVRFSVIPFAPQFQLRESPSTSIRTSFIAGRHCHLGQPRSRPATTRWPILSHGVYGTARGSTLPSDPGRAPTTGTHLVPCVCAGRAGCRVSASAGARLHSRHPHPRVVEVVCLGFGATGDVAAPRHAPAPRAGPDSPATDPEPRHKEGCRSGTEPRALARPRTLRQRRDRTAGGSPTRELHSSHTPPQDPHTFLNQSSSGAPAERSGAVEW
jgi:hypothetical protein